MLNVILVALMALCFVVGLVTLFFPFGKESVKTVNVAPAVKSAAQVSLEEIRDQARKATAEDIQVFVAWFEGFHGYNREIPSSIRYQHMLEWREITDKLHKELPADLVQPWFSIVHNWR
jgi:hypothetical protein